MLFKRTTAINKLLKLNKRKRIIQGGTWAGKTYGIIPCLINNAIITPNQSCTVVAESIPAIKTGALANFQEIMQNTNRWVQSNYNGTDRTYTFKNKSSIQFTSFDSISKAKNAGKRNELFINEANYISFEIADALMMRTSGSIWIDFNPTQSFWAHDEVLTQSDSEFLLLKYTDNECLPNTILEELMQKLEKAKTSAYWDNWCNVYIHGQIGTMEGIIFKEINIVDSFPEDCKRIVYGMDFGFTNDPTTLVKIGLHNGELYCDEIIYKTGLTNTDLNNLMIQKDVNRNTSILADSADPRSIEELRRMGWNIKGAIKGQDSVTNGIDAMQRYKRNVTSSSLNMIKEFRHYQWEIDKATGKHINVPIDEYNHCIDAARYACTAFIRNKIGIIWQ